MSEQGERMARAAGSGDRGSEQGERVARAAGSGDRGSEQGERVARAAGSGDRGSEQDVRVRLRYAKHGKVRWTSHRDAARIWERGLRRAGIAVAYTEGFSPRPRLHF